MHPAGRGLYEAGAIDALAIRELVRGVCRR